MAGKLSMASLTRAWTLLLKGLQETLAAPSPLRAAEMALIRLCYVADLPSPADAIKALQNGGGVPAAAHPLRPRREATVVAARPRAWPPSRPPPWPPRRRRRCRRRVTSPRSWRCSRRAARPGWSTA